MNDYGECTLNRYNSHYRFAKRLEERARSQPESAFQSFKFAELPGGSRPIHFQLVNTANLSVPKLNPRPARRWRRGRSVSRARHATQSKLSRWRFRQTLITETNICSNP